MENDIPYIDTITICVPFVIGIAWVVVGLLLLNLKSSRSHVDRSYLRSTIWTILSCNKSNQEETNQFSGIIDSKEANRINARVVGLKILQDRGKITLLIGLFLIVVGIVYLFMNFFAPVTTNTFGSAIKILFVTFIIILSVIIINVRGRHLSKKLEVALKQNITMEMEAKGVQEQTPLDNIIE